MDLIIKTIFSMTKDTRRLNEQCKKISKDDCTIQKQEEVANGKVPRALKDNVLPH